MELLNGVFDACQGTTNSAATCVPILAGKHWLVKSKFGSESQCVLDADSINEGTLEFTSGQGVLVGITS